MYISGKDKLGYINGDFPHSQMTDLAYRKWKTEDTIVKGWLINNMDSSLIANSFVFQSQKLYGMPLQQLTLMGQIHLSCMIYNGE